jgi:hypothetical protein
MPDTQFLYRGSQNSVNRTPQEESFRYIIDNDIVFMAHLGDLTEDADPASFEQVGKAFDLLESHGVAYSVLAGNHDVSGDDSRDDLINTNDQIFLTLNGHYWPPGRTIRKNATGNVVHLHIANYQNRYFGGGAMLRLYHFDLARNTIDVETPAPWILAQPPAQRNTLAAREARLTTPVDDFSMPIDFPARFAGFLPVPVRPARPAGSVLVPGTLAYWRFDAGGANGTPFAAAQTVRDPPGHRARFRGRRPDLVGRPPPGPARPRQPPLRGRPEPRCTAPI